MAQKSTTHVFCNPITNLHKHSTSFKTASWNKQNGSVSLLLVALIFLTPHPRPYRHHHTKKTGPASAVTVVARTGKEEGTTLESCVCGARVVLPDKAAKVVWRDTQKTPRLRKKRQEWRRQALGPWALGGEGTAVPSARGGDEEGEEEEEADARDGGEVEARLPAGVVLLSKQISKQGGF